MDCDHRAAVERLRPWMHLAGLRRERQPHALIGYHRIDDVAMPHEHVVRDIHLLDRGEDAVVEGIAGGLLVADAKGVLIALVPAGGAVALLYGDRSGIEPGAERGPPGVQIGVHRYVHQDGAVAAAPRPDQRGLLPVPDQLPVGELVIEEMLFALFVGQPHAVVRIDHEEHVHGPTVPVDRDQVVPVAERRIAILVKEVFLRAVVGEHGIDEGDAVRLLLVVIAPDQTPWNIETVHVVGEGRIRLRLIGHGDVARDGDELGFDPVDERADRVVHHSEGIVISGIVWIVVTLIQLHVGQVQDGELVPLHIERKHRASAASFLL